MDRSAFDERLASLRESRYRLPEVVRNRLQSRHRRSIAGHGGRLVIFQADHPAHGELAAAGDPLALADRGELLFRLYTALGCRGVDGVIATADILDDLLLLEALEDRLAIGSMNRGGLPGSAFTHDDRFTGYDAETILSGRLDGGKMGLVIDPTDPVTANTIEACGRSVSALAIGTTMALVAPAWISRAAGGTADLSSEALIRSMDVAAGLGGRSPFTWLALPAQGVTAEVAAATTLPILLVAPEDASVDAARTTWAAAMDLPGVRGIVLPVAVLYGASADVVATVDAWVDLARGGPAEGERS